MRERNSEMHFARWKRELIWQLAILVGGDCICELLGQIAFT